MSMAYTCFKCFASFFNGHYGWDIGEASLLLFSTDSRPYGVLPFEHRFVELEMDTDHGNERWWGSFRAGLPVQHLIPVSELVNVPGIDQASLTQFIRDIRAQGVDVDQLFALDPRKPDSDEWPGFELEVMMGEYLPLSAWLE